MSFIMPPECRFNVDKVRDDFNLLGSINFAAGVSDSMERYRAYELRYDQNPESVQQQFRASIYSKTSNLI